MGTLAILKDYGFVTRGQVFGDASAALGVINRKGLGRTRHIDTGLLWIQETAASKRLQFTKVLGAINPADLMTKYLTREVLMGHCDGVNLYFKDGRAQAAPQLNTIQKALFDYDFEDSDENNYHNPRDENDDLITRIQIVINKIWYDKWKKLCHTTIRNAIQP